MTITLLARIRLGGLEKKLSYGGQSPMRPHANMCKPSFLTFPLCVLILLSAGHGIRAQSGGHKLYGDVKVYESNGVASIRFDETFDVTLYSSSGTIIGRQPVRNRGRYQFLNLSDGQYDLVIEFRNNEIGRIQVRISGPSNKDFCQDIELGWHAGSASIKPGTVSVEDFYERPPSNEEQFKKAQQEINKKKYAESTARLKKILETDPADFQSWTELGTVYLLENRLVEAERAYVHATELRPRYFLALRNLGWLKIWRKDFEGAILVLTRAVEVKPTSADANYYLGEAYLQVRQGSKAVPYLNAALKLDPIGKAEVHLRIAALYIGTGLKEKAALEYVSFLKKKPDYPDRRRLERYIAANKQKP
jgi:Flp pilus assembly protein TadD